MLGHSLLTQFEGVRFQEVTLPFVDTVEKAREIVVRINESAVSAGVRPIVISTLVNTEIAAIVGAANALFLDCFEIFISPLEIRARRNRVSCDWTQPQRARSGELLSPDRRGQLCAGPRRWRCNARSFGRRHHTRRCVALGKNADVPDMAMQFGIRAANYPLVPEDFGTMQLPGQVRPLRARLRGLTIRPERLQQIRNERRPGSKYATLANCEYEVRQAEAS
jgi:regulator of PEP synthase PpsR (kinase-PPPase family)